MTREELSKKIHWPWIIWTAGIVNVVAMLPQLYKLITTQQTEGLALGMFWMYFGIQVSFSLEGYFTRNRMLMTCLGLSAIVSAAIIVQVVYLRHLA